MTLRSCPVLVLALLILAAVPSAGAEVKIFRSHSQEDFLQGTLKGVSLDPLGRLQLADRVEKVSAVAEPFVFSAASHPDGWVLGTGNDGKVLLVERDGTVRELFAVEEPEVFAVWADAKGTVYAGSSPGGKVYRYRQGVAEVFFETREDYIWDFAPAPGGGLLVATGTRGRLYRVDEKGHGEVILDAEDTHLRCLAVLPGGDVLAGTAGEGLVLRLARDGSVRTLLDGERPEVVDLAVDPEGGIYVGLLASEASLVDLAAKANGKAKKEGDDGETEEGQASVTVTAEAAVGSRPARFQGARSEIVRIAPSGAVQPVWSFQDETVHSLLWLRDRLWVGTGLEGKIYSRRDETMVLEEDVDERQVVALLPDDPGPAFATSNAAAFYRLEARPRREGSYTSPVLDAEEVARFGSLRWYGDAAEATAPRFSARSGISSEPDRTWSDWLPVVGGAEVDLSGLPRGRYVQWRAELAGDGESSPRLDEVLLSYRQDNVRPEISTLAVLEPGKILVPTGFNPSTQVFEPTSPSRDGIFTSLTPAAPDEPRTKALWKPGYRTLQWEAEDANSDPLRYRIEFRPEASGDGEGRWLEVAEELEESWYSFDATVLPDGRYRFRLTASDEEANLPGEGLARERISEPVVIDHSVPVIRGIEGKGDELRVRVADAWSPLREAVISIDAGPWEPVRVADELLDEQEEELVLDLPPKASLVLLRLTDTAHNRVTHDLSGRMR